jgi:ATP-binding cassette subfamily C protein
MVYLAPAASDQTINAAAKAIGASPLLERLGGLDCVVGPGGTELSRGEKQLVALVRAYLSEAPVIILDEATSELDGATEAVAEQAFARRGGTLLVIAHRLTSAARAGQVLLLNGDEALTGTHDQLVTRSAFYADLVGHWTPHGSVPGTGRRKAVSGAVSRPIKG